MVEEPEEDLEPQDSEDIKNTDKEEFVEQEGIDDILSEMQDRSSSEEENHSISEDQGSIDDILNSAKKNTGSDSSILGEEGSEKDVFLDQSDIDALINENKSKPNELILDFNGKKFPAGKKVNYEICDFRNPVFLSERELRQIRIRHESFIHYLSAHLSIFLRMGVTLNMSKLHTLPYEKFLETIETPTYISLFKINPLNGVSVFNISPRLALTMVNRMLGGKGHSITTDRFLTEIEMSIIDDVVQIVIDEWISLWSDMDEIGDMIPSLVGRENNGRFLQTAPRDAIMLILDVETGIGDCSELFQIAFPYYFIEPIVRILQNESKKYEKIEVTEKKAKWYPSYNDIEVPLYAEWEPCYLSVSDLLKIREGDVIEMPRDAIKNTRIRVHDEIRYISEVGIENNQVAVNITEKIESSKFIDHE